MHSFKLFFKLLYNEGYALYGHGPRPWPPFLPKTNRMRDNVWSIRYSTSQKSLCKCKLLLMQLRTVQSSVSSDILGTKDDVFHFLRNDLNCSDEECSVIFRHNCDFLVKNLSKTRQAVQVLTRFGITNNTIKEHFWTVFMDKDQLEARLQLLKRWSFQNINNGISFLKLSYPKFQKCTAYHENDSVLINGNNRITYFALFVQCHEKEACELFTKYKFLLTIKVIYMKDILQLLKEEGVAWKDVMRDPWLFRYSPRFLSERVRQLAEVGARAKCGRIKPWMLRSPQSTLHRYLTLRDQNRAALGSYSNVCELLARELQLTETEVADMMARHPPLAKLRCAKARDMCNFLRESGFTSHTIFLVPRALCHKRDTLKTRLCELRQLGGGPGLLSLQNVCRNQKDYVALIKRITL